MARLIGNIPKNRDIRREKRKDLLLRNFLDNVIL